MPTHTPNRGKEPNWLKRGDGSQQLFDHRIQYFRALWQATPTWLSVEQRKAIARIHREAKRRRRAGADVVVDHIVPLTSDYVCGLNVAWNLQISPRLVNACKSNRVWPGHPCETIDLFETYVPQQLQLHV